MNIDHRIEALPKQERSYIIGNIELINGEWIFFDDINEKAFQFNELEKQIELLIEENWLKGEVTGHGVLKLSNDYYYLKNGDQIRIKKPLYYSFQELLLELEDSCFFGFIQTLNNLSYSLYDCIFCHNFLSFSNGGEHSGMNTIIFDNQDMICTVQHHFKRGDHKKDRFEITKSDGSRFICGYW